MHSGIHTLVAHFLVIDKASQLNGDSSNSLEPTAQDVRGSII